MYIIHKLLMYKYENMINTNIEKLLSEDIWRAEPLK